MADTCHQHDSQLFSKNWLWLCANRLLSNVNSLIRISIFGRPILSLDRYRPFLLSPAATQFCSLIEIIIFTGFFVCVVVPVWLQLFHRLWGSRFGPFCPVHFTRFSSLRFVCPVRAAHSDWLVQLTIWPSQFAYSHSYLLNTPLCRMCAGSYWENAISSWACILHLFGFSQGYIHTCVLIVTYLARSGVA